MPYLSTVATFVSSSHIPLLSVSTIFDALHFKLYIWCCRSNIEDEEDEVNQLFAETPWPHDQVWTCAKFDICKLLFVSSAFSNLFFMWVSATCARLVFARKWEWLWCTTTNPGLLCTQVGKYSWEIKYSWEMQLINTIYKYSWKIQLRNNIVEKRKWEWLWCTTTNSCVHNLRNTFVEYCWEIQLTNTFEKYSWETHLRNNTVAK